MLTVVLFLLGLVIGSFLNVLIWRLPRGEGVASGHSRCTGCDQTIAWYDLIPLASFFILRRRCRRCRQPISWRYPLVELITGLLFVSLYWALASSNTQQGLILMLYWAVALSGILTIGIIDFTHFIIPDKILIVLGLLAVVHALMGTPLNFLATALIASAMFALVYWVTRGRGLGWGDVKFVFVLGLLFGFPAMLFVIYGALFLGVIWGGGLLLTKRGNLKSKLPFGAVLAVSAITTVLAHGWLINLTDRYFYYLYHF